LRQSRARPCGQHPTPGTVLVWKKNLYRMSQQPNLLPTNTSQGSATSKSSRRIPAWLERIELFLRVIVRLYVGLLVFVLPWMHFWDENHIFTYFPQFAAFTSNGIVRGLVSGLGLLNIYIAISDAVHYKES
jgi:hypothetical protein